MGVGRRVLLWGSESEWLRQQLSHRAFVQRAVRRFVPGEALEDAILAARALDSRGLGTVLTLLGENVRSAPDAQAVAGVYGTALEAVRTAGLDADLSVKPTHLGLDLDFELALENLESLATTAAAGNRVVWLDMESSGYVDRTLVLYRRLRQAHDNVGVCLQAYLFRTASDLESLLPISPILRLVKGAYKEPPELSYPRKSDVDANYLRLATRMLASAPADSRGRCAFGTHDERLIRQISGIRDARGLRSDACEFQMLYGIRSGLQASLAATGHPTRVLVSYGSHWFPWFMRRLAERPANVWFMLRSMPRR